MKKKIILSFMALFLLFLSGIALTLYIVNKTTANLDALLTLHKVEIIRQELVINVQTVQSNLYTSGTLFGKELDVIVDNVLKLQDRVYTCTECHHEPEVEQEILDLQALTEQYKEALSYFITSTADRQRIGRLQAVAADIGDMIISGSQEMALAANETLRRRTIDAQEKVSRSRQLLALTLAVSLAIVIIVALYLINTITRPVSELLKATRKIRQGELGYTSSYTGRDEFRELMESFNDMSHSLSENNQKILSHMLRNQTILQTSTDGFVLIDEEGRVAEANPALCGMTGYSQDQITAMCFIDLIELPLFPEREDILARVRKTGSLTSQVNLKTQSGGIVAGEISATFAEMEHKGNYFCFIRDITERKKMEEELLKGQKLESLGVLAGGIAHDFNNLLTGIIGYVDLAMKTVASGDKIHGWLESAKKASVRAQNLTQQLLTFSKGGEPVKKLLSIKELIEESAGFVLSGSNVKCEYHYKERLWPVNADKGQISQVIQNIILNGAQSMPAGGIMTVQAENVVVRENDPVSLAPGDYVKMVFTDQGPGISKKDRAKIFDPYFTTKQYGNGLGLTICHSIVSKHRGSIMVESKPGAGTSFAVYLPARRSSAREADIELSGLDLHGTGRVLVMDDEEQIRGIVGEMLTHLGYEPSFARDGAEAMELYRKAMLNAVPYDAVIMDLTIPGGMGGKEAVANLLQMDPGAKVIVSSGYSNDPVMAEYYAYGFSGVVTKPFDMEQLSKVLHDIISVRPE
ncbi:MAG: response regulator [Desulfobulbaceae bacterium]|nr:response regulator [Desulfobulbaceae bacterium]